MVYVKDADGFFFNATHFKPEMLEAAKHDDELVPLDEIVVSADKFIVPASGVNDYTAAEEPQRVIDDSHIDFEVTLRCVDKDTDCFNFI